MPLRSPAKKRATKETPAVIAARWEEYRATQKTKAAKGGKARAAKLSKKELSKQGRAAVNARWAKHRAKVGKK